MVGAEENRVRARRVARGLTQQALAQAAQLSRQSVGAIEAGRALPAVDVALRLAAALDATVEELFGAGDDPPTVAARAFGPPSAGRVALAEIADRWVAYPLGGAGLVSSADGIARPGRGARTEVEPLRPTAELQQRLVLVGCAAALGLLADRLNTRGGRCLWVAGSSTRALEALAAREAHVAGVHLTDARSGEPSLSEVQRHAGREPLALVTLAGWEAGLVLPRGNPRRIRAVADLGRRGLRLVTREPGSGARRLLERTLRTAGLPVALAARAPLQASGHLELAQAIALGAADAGVATRDVAISLGLDFLPLAEERYDLVLPRSALEDPRVTRLLDVLAAAPTRRELEALGYDVRHSGARVGEVPAA